MGILDDHHLNQPIYEFERDTRELDRWAIIGPTLEFCRSWIDENLIVQYVRASDYAVVAPIYDPTDPFFIKICTENRHITGLIYYEYINLFPKNRVLTDAQDRFILFTDRSVRLRNTRTTHQHPEPRTQEEYYEWLDTSYRN